MIIQSYSDISNKCGVVTSFRQEIFPKSNKHGGPYKGVQVELFQYSDFGNCKPKNSSLQNYLFRFRFDGVSAGIEPDLDPEIGTKILDSELEFRNYDLGSRIQDLGSRIQDVGSRMLDSDLGFGFRMQNFGYWILELEN